MYRGVFKIQQSIFIMHSHPQAALKDKGTGKTSQIPSTTIVWGVQIRMWFLKGKELKSSTGTLTRVVICSHFGCWYDVHGRHNALSFRPSHSLIIQKACQRAIQKKKN